MGSHAYYPIHYHSLELEYYIGMCILLLLYIRYVYIIIIFQMNLYMDSQSKCQILVAIYPNCANYDDVILGKVKSRKSDQLFFE